MPTFDVVSEVDRQEVKNAIDQAQREISTRFDFKNTNSSIELADLAVTLRTVSEDRLKALRLVVEEKLVKRGVSLKGLDWGKVEEATQNTVRQGRGGSGFTDGVSITTTRVFCTGVWCWISTSTRSRTRSSPRCRPRPIRG